MIRKILFVVLSISYVGTAATNQAVSYWNNKTLITPFRLSMIAPGTTPEYVDLDGDEDPDVLRVTLPDGIKIQWIDDDDDMKQGDLEGDLDSDCLMIDRDGDGRYGHFDDLMIDWCDENGDGVADLQVIVENGPQSSMQGKPGHHMIVIDTDHDNVFNYVDWNLYDIMSWNQIGHNQFYTDYLGRSLFIKIHSTTYSIGDLRKNWENPFLFYDPDHDGLSEMAIRCIDQYYRDRTPIECPDQSEDITFRPVKYTGRIQEVAISIDMDNDNIQDFSCDYDMSINFKGDEGFDYTDQKHIWKSLRGLPEADKFFYDPRWRQMTELLYPDHDDTWDLIFKRGKWDSIRFVYDEDDDSDRWERVEFYNFEDMDSVFRIGARNNGLDNHSQSDVAGDRGEWDQDASGNAKLYISPMDGRLHLYGAEVAAWRVDQEGRHRFHHRWEFPDWTRPKAPEKVATVFYKDTDENGFLDTIQYDLDGDKQFETSVSLKRLTVEDKGELYDPATMNYADFHELHKKVSDGLWDRAQKAMAICDKLGINTQWYAFMQNPRTLREKYNFGYWLNFYLYQDIRHWVSLQKNADQVTLVDKAYYSGNWSLAENL
jgi:hypothetical protein